LSGKFWAVRNQTEEVVPASLHRRHNALEDFAERTIGMIGNVVTKVLDESVIKLPAVPRGLDILKLRVAFAKRWHPGGHADRTSDIGPGEC